MRFDPIRVIEACYAPAADDGAWLAALAEAFAPLAEGGSAWAQVFDARDASRLRITTRACGPEPAWSEVLLPAWPSAPQRLVDVFFAPRPVVDSFSRRALAIRHDEAGLLRRFRARRARSESYAVLAPCARGCGVAAGFAQRSGYRLPARLAHQLVQLASHLASAARLRRGLCAPPADAAAPEAVLDPAGRVHDASGWALDPEARGRLGEAVRLVERARGRLRETDPDAALALWRGLVDGRWSLVDQIEADGRRWVLARRNAADARDPTALTERERAVALHAATGRANKWIAWALGVTPSTVSGHLESAQRKLRLASRGALIDFFRVQDPPVEGSP